MPRIPADLRPAGGTRSCERSRGRPTWLVVTSALAAALTTCAGTQSSLRERTFAVGQQRSARSGTTLELQHAHYGPQVVRLRVKLHNDGDVAIHIKRDGILLAYDGLEYPLNDTTAAQLDEVTALLPNANARFEIAFRLARPMTREGRLVLRGMTRESQALAPLSLVIPAVLDDSLPSREQAAALTAAGRWVL